MDEFLSRRSLPEGTEQGPIGVSSRYKLEVRPVRAPDELILGNDWELKEIALDVTVSDAGRERHVELRTLRLVKKGNP
jgi:hypothetical protein